MENPNSRFEIQRPPYLADGYWQCISAEADRLWRSLEAQDASQALGDIKCLVESVAKIVLDINGTPPPPSEDFKKVVGDAHKLLAQQTGYGLVHTSPFGDMANQALKVARNLAEVRNNYGGGHGRFRTPDLADEMLHMALDGGLMWVRWAVRRVSYFAEGRPTPLINDLIVNQQTFYSGVLKRRLVAANLPSLEDKHQRSIGVAVGQRAAQGTFVVSHDGVDACRDSDDLNTWPAGYRIGVVSGLWFDPQGRVTLTSNSITDALKILDPIPDCATELTDWVEEIVKSKIVLTDTEEITTVVTAWKAILNRIDDRPTSEHAAWKKFADFIEPTPF
ncbi:hypothetical protein [Nocardia sp. NPDC047038]|uniref:hypothetical protein n=1 Tax=Nocardia sp. NPDC047038 TaxID=3154338 RepID=UPI0034032FAE